MLIKVQQSSEYELHYDSSGSPLDNLESQIDGLSFMKFAY